MKLQRSATQTLTPSDQCPRRLSSPRSAASLIPIFFTTRTPCRSVISSFGFAALVFRLISSYVQISDAPACRRLNYPAT
jgi:hypothetical protein